MLSSENQASSELKAANSNSLNIKENFTLVKLDHNLIKTQLESIKMEEASKLEREISNNINLGNSKFKLILNLKDRNAKISILRSRDG